MKRNNKKTYVAPLTEVIEGQPCAPLCESGQLDSEYVLGKQGSFFDEYVGDSETTAANATDKWENLSGWGE